MKTEDESEANTDEDVSQIFVDMLEKNIKEI